MTKLKRGSAPLGDSRASGSAGPASLSTQQWAGVVIILFATCVAYFPAMRGDFLLDDDKLLIGSRLVHASDGLYQFWFTTNAADYWPMTNTSFWLEWRLWGTNSTGYHITNLILHLAATFLIWGILRKLAIGGAFLAALLFAVHPVNVESVAWISQRKNTLAMFFFLLSILWYLKTEEEKSRRGEQRKLWDRWYWLSLLAFLLAMLSKGSAAVLPAVLLLIVWWQRRRIDVWDIARAAPFFLVAIVLTGVNIWFQKHGLDVEVREVSFTQRLAGAGAIIWFYLAKVFAPINLVFVYPQWKIDTRAMLWWLPLAAAMAFTVLLVRQWVLPTTTWARALLFAWLVFCMALVPVLGFADVGFMQHSLVSDHYQHIAIIAVVALAAAGWSTWHRREQQAALITAVGIVGGLVFLSWQQSRLYGNVIDLYQDTVTKNPGSWLAHNNLGTTLLHVDRVQDAFEQIQEALKLNPNSAEVHYNLGYALDRAGRYPEAIEQLKEALHLKPQFPEAHTNFANALKQLGKLPEAIEEYQQAILLRPDYAEAHNNLGSTLMVAGRYQDAIDHIQRAIELKPELAGAHNNLGLALSAAGKLPEAVTQFQAAVRLKPDYAEAYSNLGYVLAAVGRVPEAIEQDQRALKLNANLPEAHYNLGKALAATGRFSEAIEHYQQALKAKPDDADTWNDLGNTLLNSKRVPEAIEAYQKAQQVKPDYVEAYNGMGAALLAAGRAQEAVQQYQQALRLKPDYAGVYNNLAATYAQLERPAEAIAAAEKGLELARAQGQTTLAGQLEKWLKKYRASQTNTGDAGQASHSVPAKP